MKTTMEQKQITMLVTTLHKVLQVAYDLGKADAMVAPTQTSKGS